jgi:hypothetical protein
MKHLILDNISTEIILNNTETLTPCDVLFGNLITNKNFQEIKNFVENNKVHYIVGYKDIEYLSSHNNEISFWLSQQCLYVKYIFINGRSLLCSYGSINTDFHKSMTSLNDCFDITISSSNISKKYNGLFGYNISCSKDISKPILKYNHCSIIGNGIFKFNKIGLCQ